LSGWGNAHLDCCSGAGNRAEPFSAADLFCFRAGRDSYQYINHQKEKHMKLLGFETILYVKDQKRSRDFYQNLLGKEPVLDVPGMTEFQLTDFTKLGLMPEEGIAKILSSNLKHPSSGNGIPRCELYLMTGDPESALDIALIAGAVLISRVKIRDWVHKAGYVSDPDGHIIAFANEI